ncbi:hypothetical protein [Kitasatospora aureofaciens]|uniref:hypothetical protein n=1 Tax=Kitasatospora aureofaciens TaxID=1894 RepID=UPI0037C8EFBF
MVLKDIDDGGPAQLALAKAAEMTEIFADRTPDKGGAAREVGGATLLAKSICRVCRSEHFVTKQLEAPTPAVSCHETNLSQYHRTSPPLRQQSRGADFPCEVEAAGLSG